MKNSLDFNWWANKAFGASQAIDRASKFVGSEAVDAAKGLSADRQFGKDLANGVVGDPKFKDGLVSTVGQNLRGHMNELPFGLGSLFLNQPQQQQQAAQPNPAQ